MILNMSGGGGAALNFNVVGGTSAPSNPKENTIWVNTNTAVSSFDFSATQPCRRSKNKNRLTYPYYHTTMTNNGITFTDNKDGTVTANGTATEQARFRPFHSTVESGLIWLEPGTYFVSGCPSGGSASTWLWEAFDADNNVTLAKDYGNGAKFTLAAGTHVRGSLIIQIGVAVSNQIWKPQIEKGSTATSFVKGDATGQVWFSTSASSSAEFNALKKNGIQVYPISAKQYVSGAWVSKTAKSYQNGAWVEWVKYLFKSGTGEVVPIDITVASNQKYTQTDESIVFSCSSSTSYAYAACTEESYDITNYSSLCIEHAFSNYDTCRIGLYTQRFTQSNVSASMRPAELVLKKSATAIVEKLDISAFTGDYYLGFNGGKLVGTLYNFWLE